MKKDFLRKNQLVERDKAIELFTLAQHRKAFLNEVESKAEKYPTLFIEGYYEVIKEMFLVILALDGWSVQNHECLLAYCNEKHNDLPLDYAFLFSLKDTRNTISYDGNMLSSQIWRKTHYKLLDSVSILSSYIENTLNLS